MSGNSDWENGEDAEPLVFLAEEYVHCPSRQHRISIPICTFRCPAEYENKEYQCREFIKAEKATRRRVLEYYLSKLGVQRRLVPESLMEGGDVDDPDSENE